MDPSSLSRAVDEAYALLRGKRWTVLTGAGCSTESGIPDYRGPLTRHRPRNPIQHRDFVSRPATRVRYWARSLVGWPRFASFQPNVAHRSLAHLEAIGHVHALITQNVDRLHHKAGSQRIIELHGALASVRCLDCGEVTARDEIQARLLELNPVFTTLEVELAPDGDADIPEDVITGFRIPACLACDGVLKPDVVFFGDNVPVPRVEASFARVEEAEALLVVGSSLTVFSGYRFVLRAAEKGRPIVIVNLGETRGDAHAQLRIDATAGAFLPELTARLDGG